MNITKTNLNFIIDEIYNNNVQAGWYSDPKTGERITRNVPEMMMLMVSEIAEGMEAFRKNLQDDKLPHRSGVIAEIGADVLIRWADLMGYLKYLGNEDAADVDSVIYEKRQYNATRKDHKLSERVKEGGKAF